MASTQEKRITAFIEPVITGLGYDLVSVRIIGSAKLQTLQIMAENPETGRLDLNGCEKISHAVSAVLDVEDPIHSAYQLEISSPGIDRPLVRDRDFEKHIGYEISVETEDGMGDNGQKRFRGKLKEFNVSTFVVATEDIGDITIERSNVARAKLILTDELAKLALKKRSEEK